MRPEDILDLVRRKPFVPFRIHVTDGSVYEIRHPEMAWIRPSTVHIGIEAKENHARGPYDHDVEFVSLNQVVRLEPLLDKSAAP